MSIYPTALNMGATAPQLLRSGRPLRSFAEQATDTFHDERTCRPGAGFTVPARTFEQVQSASVGAMPTNTVRSNLGRGAHATLPLWQLRTCYGGPDEVPGDEVTTLMIRNLPRTYTSEAFMREVETVTPRDSFDFVYVPWDARRRSNISYAFINFVDPEAASRCFFGLSGRRWHLVESPKSCRIAPARIQGLGPNLAHYVASGGFQAKGKGSVYRPIVLCGGKPVPSLSLAVRAFCSSEVLEAAAEDARQTREAAAAAATLGLSAAATANILQPEDQLRDEVEEFRSAFRRFCQEIACTRRSSPGPHEQATHDRSLLFWARFRDLCFEFAECPGAESTSDTMLAALGNPPDFLQTADFCAERQQTARSTVITAPGLAKADANAEMQQPAHSAVPIPPGLGLQPARSASVTPPGLAQADVSAEMQQLARSAVPSPPNLAPAAAGAERLQPARSAPVTTPCLARADVGAERLQPARSTLVNLPCMPRASTGVDMQQPACPAIVGGVASRTCDTGSSNDRWLPAELPCGEAEDGMLADAVPGGMQPTMQGVLEPASRSFFHLPTDAQSARAGLGVKALRYCL